jgi:hypothetical protein
MHVVQVWSMSKGSETGLLEGSDSNAIKVKQNMKGFID